MRLWASAFGPLADQLKEQNQLWCLSDMWVWTSVECRGLMETRLGTTWVESGLTVFVSCGDSRIEDRRGSQQ